MREGVKQYPRQKATRLPWLGPIPDHWQLRRMKTVVRERVLKGFPDEPLLAATQTRGVVTKEQYENRTVVAMKDLHLLKLVREGDFVISLRSFQGGIEYAREQGIISPAYTVLFPADPKSHAYLSRLFKSKPYIDNLSQHVTGIRQGQNIDYERLGRSAIPLPPLAEQNSIVRFLDYADTRIRRCIAARQKLIKLVEEQKQGIIHRAVTRGLDPNVSLKPSGVEWLGDVPEHWQVARAATVCSFLSGKAHEQFVEPDGRHICVTARFVSTSGRSSRRCTENLSPARRGDVLMVMSDLPRGRALARAYLVDDDQSYAVNQRVCIVRPVRVHPQFLAFSVNRHPELLAHDDGFNQTHLPNAAFKIMRLPLPPLDEQAAIGGFLARESTVREAAVRRAEREVELLGEYRTRLIADVVTGKLDVHGAAARLPDDPDEPGLLDEPHLTDADDAADDLDAVPEKAEA